MLCLLSYKEFSSFLPFQLVYAFHMTNKTYHVTSRHILRQCLLLICMCWTLRKPVKDTKKETWILSKVNSYFLWIVIKSSYCNWWRPTPLCTIHRWSTALAHTHLVDEANFVQGIISHMPGTHGPKHNIAIYNNCTLYFYCKFRGSSASIIMEEWERER